MNVKNASISLLQLLPMINVILNDHNTSLQSVFSGSWRRNLENFIVTHSKVDETREKTEETMKRLATVSFRKRTTSTSTRS